MNLYKVIAYGISGTLDMCKEYIQNRFCLIGFSDSNPNKSHSLKNPQQYIRPEAIIQCDFDFVIITSIFDKEIKYSLVNQYFVPKEKILLLGEWQGMHCKKSFGNRNPDKTFYVMSRFFRYRDGLFSSVFSFLEQLDYVDQHGYIPVIDMKYYKNQYLEEDKLKTENSWEYYFEQLSNYSLDEIYKSQNVVLGYDKALYFDDLKRYNLKRYSQLWKKYIRLNADIKEKIGDAQKALFHPGERVLGVLYRGTDYNQLKLKNHAIQPEFNELFQFIDQELLNAKYNKIFVSTESETALNHIKKKYGSMVIYTNQKRFFDTGEKWLSEIKFERNNDRYLRGYEYLETIMILSKCTSLIAGLCCGSVCAKIINNGKYESERLIKKGVY